MPQTSQRLRAVSLIILLFFSISLNAQSRFANTLQFDPAQGSPPATISQLSWLSGYWQGQMWGGQTEEIWSEPLAGSMMASFKFASAGKVNFYELITLFEHEGSLLMRLKHFNADLVGWEEKAEFVDFKLVKLEEHAAYFDGCTYRLISPDELHVFVVIDQDGKESEVQFVFKRRH